MSNFHLTTAWFLGSLRDETAHVNEGPPVKKPFVGEGCRGSREQGNRHDSKFLIFIQDLLKTWRLTLNLNSDYTWSVLHVVQPIFSGVVAI